jgi:hypothetical protein
MVSDGPNQKTHTDKGNKETHRSQEEPAPRPVWNALMDNVAELCEVKQQQHRGGCKEGKDEKNPRAGDVHFQLKIHFDADNNHPKTQTRSIELRAWEMLRT